jgi:hypothetical protein
MATAATISPLFLRDIIDKIGIDDSFFPTEAPECTLPGPRTSDVLALEDSLRSLITRVQTLEQKARVAEDKPPPKQLNNVKAEEPKKICLSCGHKLEVPLTPGETPPVDMSVQRSAPSISLRLSVNQSP